MSSLQSSRHINFWQMTLIVAPLIAVGYIVVRIFAAGPAASFLLSSATISGNASVQSNASAIGGQMLVFGVAAPTPTPAATSTPTPSPTPAPGTKPDLTNTGAHSATRTDLPTLTTASNPTIVSGTPGNPTVIRDKKFTNTGIVFVGHDVLFINCLFQGSTTDQLIEIRDSTPANQSIEFRDSTIGFAAPAGQHPFGYISGIKFTRTLIYDGDHEIHDIDPTGYVNFDSSILDARDTSDHEAQLGGPHGNTIYTEDGPAPHVTAYNAIFYGGNSFVFFNNAPQGSGTDIVGWSFDHCWFYGNNRNTSWTSGAVFFGGGTSPTAFKNFIVTNSRFQREGTGLDTIVRGGVTFAQWTGNVWDDNGAAIPVP